MLLHPAFFLLRRLIVAFAIVVGRETLILQIYLIWAQSVTAVAIISYTNPFETGAERRTEYFNEVVSVWILFASMCLSNFGPDSETKVYVGYFICGLIAFHLLFNIGKMILFAAFKLKRTYFMKAAKKNQASLVKLVHAAKQAKREIEAKEKEAERLRVQEELRVKLERRTFLNAF